jgi:hypothetical protein
VFTVELHYIDHSVMRTKASDGDDHTSGIAVRGELEAQRAQGKQATVDTPPLLDGFRDTVVSRRTTVLGPGEDWATEI